MTTIDSNLRKAAVLLRSLDADTAAMLLAQLSPEEAAAIRAAIRALGPIDPEEQADVVAEFRRDAARRRRNRRRAASNWRFRRRSTATTSPRARGFETTSSIGRSDSSFWKHAPTSALVRIPGARACANDCRRAVASRARASGRRAGRAAGKTAGRNDRTAVGPRRNGSGERHRAGARAGRVGCHSGATTAARSPRRRDTVANRFWPRPMRRSRRGILGNLKIAQRALAEQIRAACSTPSRTPARQAARRDESQRRLSTNASARNASLEPPIASRAPAASPQPQPLPRIDFDQLDPSRRRARWRRVLRDVDANVLALALAGSRDELVDRICEQMPKRTARAFRRELRRLGPTRLSDVEAAQRAVAGRRRAATCAAATVARRCRSQLTIELAQRE